MALTLKSSAFVNEGAIPSKYSAYHEDLSPPLAWSDAPAGTKSFALISDDPDAPAKVWVHWVIWNIPPMATNLKEGIAKSATLGDGTRQGVNDSSETGWNGPMPPSGTHRYYFKLYALDTILNLSSDTIKPTLEAAMKGHILAQATLMGTYKSER